MAGRSMSFDPIAQAQANWTQAGWGDVADGMVAVTSVMRAHQILLARVEASLRPYDLTFSRFELLRLLAFSRQGCKNKHGWPIQQIILPRLALNIPGLFPAAADIP